MLLHYYYYDEKHGNNYNDQSNKINNNQLFQYAVKSEFTYNQTDLSLYFCDHMDRFQPVFTQNGSELVPNYFQVQQFGFTSQSAIKDFLVKIEYGYRNFIGKHNSMSQQNHTQLAVGTEYSYYHVNGFESTLFTEYSIIPDVSKSIRSQLSIFQNDLLLGYRLSLNNESSSEVQLFFFKDLDYDSDHLLSVNLSQRFFDRIKGNIGLQWVYSKNNQNSGFESIKNADFAYFSVTNYF